MTDLRKTFRSHLANFFCLEEGRGMSDEDYARVQRLLEFLERRNLGHHRKFFALLDVVFQTQSKFATKDGLLDALKIALGHHMTWRVEGREILRPKSISFAAMDQTAFESFYDGAVALILERLLPNTDRADWPAPFNRIQGLS